MTAEPHSAELQADIRELVLKHLDGGKTPDLEVANALLSAARAILAVNISYNKGFVEENPDAIGN